MSRKDKLRCVNCYKRDWPKYSIWKTLKSITWRNIELFENTVNSVKCMCKTCGHEYISKSAAAFRALNTKSP